MMNKTEQKNDSMLKDFLFAILFGVVCFFIMATILKAESSNRKTRCALIGGQVTKTPTGDKCVKKELFNEIFENNRITK